MFKVHGVPFDQHADRDNGVESARAFGRETAAGDRC